MNKNNSQITEVQIQAAQQGRFPFLEFDTSLETDFLQYRHERLLQRILPISLAALVIFLAFAVLDLVIFPPEVSVIAVSIRLFIICPLIMLAIRGSYKKWSLTLFNRFYLAGYLISGLGIVVIIYTAHLHQVFLPFDGLLLHLIFGYFLMSMPFYHIVITSYLISLSYFCFEYYLNQTADVLVYNAIFMITVNIMGTVGSYLQERSRRSLFLHEKMLALAKLKDEREIESKTRLLATASHDLRQPLHAMNLLVETLEERLEESEELSLTKHLKSSIRQLNQLFGSLLNISRLNAGVVSPNNQHFDLAELLGSLIKNQQQRAEHLGIKLISDGPRLCYVYSDTILISRILNNLFENVFEHADAQQLEISWSQQGEKIRLKIKDDGKGIPENEVKAVFEEFHQVGDTHKLGMGLGLSIIKQLCDLLTLEFVFTSSAGEGCCVLLDLNAGAIPVSESVRDTNVGFSKIEKATGGCIVIVDDDPNVLASMTTLLSGWAYVVRAYSSPDDVLNDLSGCQPALIISDYHFSNNMDGLALISKVRAETQADLPAILITADTQENIEEHMHTHFNKQEKRQTQYLNKPVQAARLRLMLNHFIANSPDNHDVKLDQ